LRSAGLELGFEPAHHDPVERLGLLDIGEMAGVGDLLVAAAGNQPGETPVLARRCARILGAAQHQGRDAERGNCAVKSKFMIAAEQPRYPAGVVAAMVSRICFHRPGFLGLKASVNQRSMVGSASGSSEVAWRTVFMRWAH
jgi:hypothetical protein